MNKQDKRNFRRKAKQFVVENDTLFHVAGKSRLQVIFDEEKKAEVIKQIHGGTAGWGHFGQNITIKKVTERSCFCIEAWSRGSSNFGESLYFETQWPGDWGSEYFDPGSKNRGRVILFRNTGGCGRNDNRHRSAPNRRLGARTADGDCNWLTHAAKTFHHRIAFCVGWYKTVLKPF